MSSLAHAAGRLVLRWESLLIVAIIGGSIWCANLSPFFTERANVLDLLTPYVFIGVMAYGLTFVVIAAEIDISITSTLAVSCVSFAQLYAHGWNLWLAAVAGLLVAVGLGLINGVLIGLLNLPSLAITLGTLAAYQGLAFVILSGEGVASFPESYTRFGGGYIHNELPVALLVLLALTVVMGVLLHATRFGRYVFAIGSNREAAQLSGIPVARMRVMLFGLSGLMAGLAGVVYVGFFGGARADAAQGSLLDVVTVVVLGGVNIFGGAGSIVGVFLAIVLVAVLRNGMQLANLGGDTQNIVIGLLLLGSILVGNAVRALQAGGLPTLRPGRRRKEVSGVEGGADVGVGVAVESKKESRNAMRAKKRFGALAVLAVAAASVAGLPASAGGATPQGGGYKIFILPKFIGINVFTENGKGAKEAGAELGDTVTYNGPTSSAPAKQVPFIDAAVRQGYNAIIISTSDPNAVAPALKRAAARGVKVVSYDGDVAPEARTIFVSPPTASDIGAFQVEWLGSQIGYKGDIAIVSSTPTSANQNTWIKFIKQTMAKPKYKGMKLVKIAYGNDDPTDSARETQGLLRAYPSLKGIIAPTTVGIASAAQVLDQEGKCKTVALTGLGLPSQMRKYVKKGCAKKFGLWNERDFGYLAAYVAHNVLAGKLTGKLGETFKAGRLGQRTVVKSDGVSPVVVLGDPLVFTPQNIDKYKF